MPKRIIHLETLLGKKVYDPAGKYAGRIEEVRAHQTAEGNCGIDDFLLGRGALLTRLSVPNLAGLFVRWLGSHPPGPATYRVPWAQLNLSDAARPQLRCSADALEKI